MFFKKKPSNKDFLRAVAVMIGYVVGVGMFSLPYVVAKAGVLTFVAMMLFFGAVQFFLHLVYANLVIATKDFHRLPGYTGLYLGKSGKYLIFAAKMIGNFGGLLAYLIISGTFIHQLLSPIFGMTEFFYGSLLFFFGAVVVYCGVGAVASFELIMSALLLLVVAMISVKGFGFIKLENYSFANLAYVLLPYGALLMAVDGLGSIPIVGQLLNKNPEAMRKAIFWGTFIPVAITIVFVFAIVGITGTSTTPDALVGVGQIIDNGVMKFALLFGVISMVTSYLLVTEAVKETLTWDFKVKDKAAWAIAVFIPYAFYALGVSNLTKVVSFAGGVAGSLSAIVLIFVFRQLARRKHHLPIFKVKPKEAFLYFLISLFILGALYEISQL